MVPSLTTLLQRLTGEWETRLRPDAMLAAVGIADGVRGVMGYRGATPQGGQATCVESMDHMAHGLVVAAEEGGHLSGVLPPPTGEQDLAAA